MAAGLSPLSRAPKRNRLLSGVELASIAFAKRLGNRLLQRQRLPNCPCREGFVGGRFNPGKVIAVFAILLLFCVAQLFNPALQRVEDKDWLDEMAERPTAG